MMNLSYHLDLTSLFGPPQGGPVVGVIGVPVADVDGLRGGGGC